MEYVIILLFLTFAFLDAIAQIPKLVGGSMSMGAVGFTVSNIIHTVKRIFVVTYPPIVALYLLDHPLNSLFKIIYVCYFGGAILSYIVLYKETFFKNILAYQISNFGSGRSLWKFWTWRKMKESYFIERRRSYSEYKIDYHFFIPSLWIYFFFGSVFFIVNIMGYLLKDYSSVILQMTGLLNAMGTLVLAFYLDPILARVFEREQGRSEVALHSVLIAQIINFGILSPAFFFALSFYLP